MGQTASTNGSDSGTRLLPATFVSFGTRAPAPWKSSVSIPPKTARPVASTVTAVVQRALTPSSPATGIMANGISGTSKRGPVDHPPVHSG